METFISNSAKETKNFAVNLIKKLLAIETKKTLIIGLVGELGAGKTQFVQGVAQYFGIKRNITSPTFVLMKKYKLTDSRFINLYHIDCYRLHSSQELLDLELEEIVKNVKNIIFIEWAEKVKNILPKNTIWVTMKDTGEQQREIETNICNK